MIHEVLPVIVDEVRDFLMSRVGASEEQVVLGNIVNQDGTIAVNGEDRVIVSLINIERDGSFQGKGMAGYGKVNAPVHINVYVIFAAYFRNTNYIEALKFISGVVGFFQGKSVFDHHNTPMMTSNANKVRLEIVNIDWRELSNLWAAIGAKYIPSVVYRIRTLDMDEDRITDEVPAVSVTDDIF